MPTATLPLSATYPLSTLAAAQLLYSASIFTLGFLMRLLDSWPHRPLADWVARPLLLLSGAGYEPLLTFPVP